MFIAPYCIYPLHGHIHQNKSPEGPYFNVSVEAINYTPIHIDEVLARIHDEHNSWVNLQP